MCFPAIFFPNIYSLCGQPCDTAAVKHISHNVWIKGWVGLEMDGKMAKEAKARHIFWVHTRHAFHYEGEIFSWLFLLFLK